MEAEAERQCGDTTSLEQLLYMEKKLGETQSLFMGGVEVKLEYVWNSEPWNKWATESRKQRVPAIEGVTR